MGGEIPSFPTGEDLDEPQRGRAGAGRRSKRKRPDEQADGASDEEASVQQPGGAVGSSAPPVAEAATVEEATAEPSAAPARRSSKPIGTATGALEQSEIFRKTLGAAMRENALAERREQRERLCRDVRRLGRFRRGCIGSDSERNAAVQWEGGEEAEQLKVLRTRIEEQKKFVQDSRTSLSRKKVSQPTDNLAGAAVTQEELDDEIWEQRELCLSKKAALEREEAELREREQQFAADRDEHFRVWRAIEVEDLVGFGSFPPLHPRYAPLRLLMKSPTTTVYRAYDLSALRTCALSVHHMDPKSQDWESRRKAAARECEQLKELRHPSLVMLLDFLSHHAGSFVIVWEHVDGDTLETYLKRNGPLQEKDARGIALQLLSVVRYLDSNSKRLQAHALRPGRLMLRNGEVKVAGTTLLEQLRPATSACSTRTFVRADSCTLNESPPPSLRAGGAQSSEAMDDAMGLDWARAAVRSIGVTLHEMLFCKLPEAGSVSESPAVIQLPDQPKVSTECRDFLFRVFDVDRRFTVQQATSDPFVCPPQRVNGKR